MQDLRVPVATIPADVVLTDGRAFSGHIFVPLVASTHEGPTRPDELLNDRSSFLPFRTAGAEAPVLLGKAQLLLITVPAWQDTADGEGSVVFPERLAAFELGDRTVEGTVLIDMPEHKGRMLDYLNHSGMFITVRDGERRHLVQKEHLLRVVEAIKG
jgi:hypothetical protein